MFNGDCGFTVDFINMDGSAIDTSKFTKNGVIFTQLVPDQKIATYPSLELLTNDLNDAYKSYDLKMIVTDQLGTIIETPFSVEILDNHCIGTWKTPTIGSINLQY